MGEVLQGRGAQTIKSSVFFSKIERFHPVSLIRSPLLWMMTVAVGMWGCAGPVRKEASVLVPGDPGAPSQITPSESMAIARNYAEHWWQPFAGNVLHGKDRAGILVNTPDISHQTPPERPGWWVPGDNNSGIPYKWGGFDDPASFDLAIANGRPGGDVSSPAKRIADNAAVSAQAAGVDCSGFVSRCLKLPRVYDTTELPSVCRPLANARDLRPGDLLNIAHRHVILCAGWAKADGSWIYYYETGGPPDYWKPALKRAPLSAVLALGYKPLRYTGMAYDPGSSGKEVLTRSVLARAAVVAVPTVGEP